MLKFSLVMFLIAVPTVAFAQPPMTMPNLNNPQAQANQRRQPPEAHTVKRGADAGSARSIPTPVLPGQSMSAVPQPPKPSRSDAIR